MKELKEKMYKELKTDSLKNRMYDTIKHFIHGYNIEDATIGILDLFDQCIKIKEPKFLNKYINSIIEPIKS